MDMMTVDDQMQPVYCVKCRKHIPRAVSSANGGLCGYCLIVQEQEILQQDKARARADYTRKLTQMGYKENGGVCLYCAEPKLWIKPGYDKNAGIRSAGMLMGCLCFLPALLLAFAPKNNSGDLAFCEACGREYKL